MEQDDVNVPNNIMMKITGKRRVSGLRREDMEGDMGGYGWDMARDIGGILGAIW